MLLDKYVYDKDIMLLAMQETGDLSNSRYKDLNNMNTFEDTNQQRNKGCAIMVKKSTMFTQFKKISKLSNIIDSVWGILSWNGKNYFVGNVYVKLDCIQGVKDVLQILNQAQALSQMHQCSGVILMGISMLVINSGMTLALTAMASTLNPTSIGQSSVYMIRVALHF